jgi:hypothetical protein
MKDQTLHCSTRKKAYRYVSPFVKEEQQSRDGLTSDACITALFLLK